MHSAIGSTSDSKYQYKNMGSYGGFRLSSINMVILHHCEGTGEVADEVYDFKLPQANSE